MTTKIIEMSLTDLVAESNAIESISRAPTEAEVKAHEDFLKLPSVTIPDLKNFVKIVSGARLRDLHGLDVVIGRHHPIPGGPEVHEELQKLLDKINAGDIQSYEAHQEYETLHPFLDGNGRSGRVLWLWMTNCEKSFDYQRAFTYGFLRTWYYQSLANYRK